MAGKKKLRRERNALLLREMLHHGAPAPRDTVALPLVDSFATPFGQFRRFAPKHSCDGCPAAKLVDQGRVFVLDHSCTIGKPFRLVKGENSEIKSRDFRNWFPHDDDAMSDKPDAAYRAAAGRRLRATRIALGIPTIRRLAQLMDVPETNLTKWENGEALVPNWFVKRLDDHYGVTYQWIFDGSKRGLPHELALKLEETPAE